MAIPILIEKWRICGTCLQYIVNNDLSSLSLYMTEEEIDQKQEQIDEALDSLAENLQTTGSAGENEEFETSACDCCGDALHGNRYDCDITDNSPLKEKDVIEGFVSDILPGLLRSETMWNPYASPDLCSRSQAFNDYTDNLHRDRQISPYLRNELCIPNILLQRIAITNDGEIVKVDLTPTKLDWRS